MPISLWYARDNDQTLLSGLPDQDSRRAESSVGQGSDELQTTRRVMSFLVITWIACEASFQALEGI